MQVVIQRGDDVDAAAFEPRARDGRIQLGEDEVDESRSNLGRSLRRCLKGGSHQQRGFHFGGGSESEVVHHIQQFAPALNGDLRRIQRVERGRFAHRRQDRGLGEGELVGGFAEVQLRGGFDPVGADPEVGAVEMPLDDLRAPELRGDLCGENTLADGAAEAGRFVVEQEVGDEFLRERGVLVRIGDACEREARVTVEVRVGGGDDGVDEVRGDVLRVLVADGDVAARGFVRRKGSEDARACAVVDARGL